MRGHGRSVGWAAALVALVAVAAGPAAAARPMNESLIPTGSLTYTWEGDQGRGCAGAGVCEVKGELVLRPLDQSQQVTLSDRGTADISVATSGTVRVLRGGSGECTDIPETLPGLGIQASLGRRSTATLGIPPSSGRCAGPLERDLAGLSIPVRRTGGSRPAFDLSTTESFGAGPFSGTFVSTLKLTPVPSPGAGGFSSSSSFGGSPGSPTLDEFAQLTYRVSPVSTAITTGFNGTGDGSCQVVDSCGATGSLTLSVKPGSTFTVFANRIVRRRFSSARTLRDLGRGRLNLSSYSMLAADVSESYGWGNGLSCHDSVALSPLLLTLGPAPGSTGSRGRLPVTVAPNNTPGVEVLRTHCPGPSDGDLIGQNEVVASGSVTPAELLAKRFTLNLTEPSAFAGLGYTGSRTGSIQLKLTLTKVRAGTSGSR